jgi:hypothetical protein
LFLIEFFLIIPAFIRGATVVNFFLVDSVRLKVAPAQQARTIENTDRFFLPEEKQITESNGITF